jgi:hypothetical protein
MENKNKVAEDEKNLFVEFSNLEDSWKSASSVPCRQVRPLCGNKFL